MLNDCDCGNNIIATNTDFNGIETKYKVACLVCKLTTDFHKTEQGADDAWNNKEVKSFDLYDYRYV